MQQASAFALEKRQGKAIGAQAGEQSLIIEHPDVRRMLLTMRAYTDAMRCVLYANAAALDVAKCHPDAEESNQRPDRAGVDANFKSLVHRFRR